MGSTRRPEGVHAAREVSFKQTRCAEINVFVLHAAVRCGTDQRQALERLCRYIRRLAPVNERVWCNTAGQVVLKMKTACREGTTRMVISPLKFMQIRIDGRFVAAKSAGSTSAVCR
jgi:hypothetical protein